MEKIHKFSREIHNEIYVKAVLFNVYPNIGETTNSCIKEITHFLKYYIPTKVSDFTADDTRE